MCELYPLETVALFRYEFIWRLKALVNEMFCLYYCLLFFLTRQPPVGHSPSYTRFLDHTQRRTTVDRTPLDE